MKPTSELIIELDGITSQFVRLLRANAYGIAKCFTCNNRGHWTEMQCGHFVARANLATRFDLRNLACQCPYCNEALRGNLEVFAMEIDKREGEGTARELVALGRTICKRPAYEYQELIETYKECVAKLKANLIQ